MSKAFKVEDLFPKNFKAFERMKKSRGIGFAEIGMKVEVYGRPGIIVGNYKANLSVCFDGNDFADNCHPRWAIQYFDKDGDLIKAFCE